MSETLRTHPHDPNIVLASRREILQTKLFIWESRAKHLKGAKKQDALRAVEDLRGKLAAL